MILIHERVEELAKQADEYLLEKVQEENRSSWAQVFAELIVKECLEACSRANEIRHLVPPTQQQVVLSCMDEIERTFRR